MSNRVGAVLAMGYAVLADLLVSVQLPPAVAAVCLTPLVLFVPGYAFVLASALPSDPRLPGRRVVVAIALTMGCVALGGLVLNALGPLEETSWSEWLVGLTCVFSIAALARDIYDGGRLSVPRPSIPRTLRSALSWQSCAAAAVVILALGTAAVLTETSSHNAYNKPVTQLSLLLVPGSSGQALRLTVTNLSTHTQRVTLTLAGAARHPQVFGVVIPASQTWTRIEPASTGEIEATLTRPGRQHAFSEVSWAG